MPYAQPDDLWQRALPPDSLWEDQGLEPGPVSAVTAAGGNAGTGSVDFDPRANPRDGWTVGLLCVRGGELTVRGVVNTGLQPQFSITLRDPVTAALIAQSRPLTPDECLIRYIRGGFGFALQNASAGAPVTVGTGNASLIFTPLFSGISVQIVVGTALGYTFYPGSAPPIPQGRLLTLTVTGSTTAAQAAAYLQGIALVADYLAVAAGGNGAGAVVAAGVTAVPLTSFAANDAWTATTQPSPDVVVALRTASARIDQVFPEDFTLPLLAWDDDVTQRCCELARWLLIVRRGLDHRQDFQVYHPASKEGPGTQWWLNQVAVGQVRPKVVQTAPGAALFPSLAPVIDPLSREGGAFPV